MKRRKYVIAVAGVIGTILGIVGAIPSFLQNKLGLAIISSILIVFGVLLIAMSFGEE